MTQRGNKLTRPLDREQPEEIGRDRSESVASNGEGGLGTTREEEDREEDAYKRRGAKGGFPQATFQSLTYPVFHTRLPRLLQHVQPLQPIPASECRQRQLRVGDPAGDRRGSSSRRLLPLSLSSRAGDDLSRDCGSNALRSWVVFSSLPVHPGHRQPCSLQSDAARYLLRPLPRGPHLCFGHHGRRTLGSPEGVAFGTGSGLVRPLGKRVF